MHPEGDDEGNGSGDDATDEVVKDIIQPPDTVKADDESGKETKMLRGNRP